MTLTVYNLVTIIYILITIAPINARLRGHHGSAAFKKLQNNRNKVHHISARHAHYSYHPPYYINYLCRYCSAPTTYPVYHAQPPSYVYKYRESGSRFSNLLTGLALYNLGRASSDHNYNYGRQDNEQCSLQVISHGAFDETIIPCFMVSSFTEKPVGVRPENLLDVTSSQIDVSPFVHEGGQLTVTSDSECVVWHNTTLNKGHNKIPCALLKKYSETLKSHGVPVYIWFPSTLAAVIVLTISCQCCCRKKKNIKEEEPINDTTVVGYSSYYP